MSKEQIEALTTVPTSMQKDKDIRNTLGRLNKLRRPNIPIYFEARNHQFMRDDEMHKNSVIEHQRRQSEASGSDCISPSIIGIVGVILRAWTI